MDTVIDFHSHILPGIDDGSSSVEESVQMLTQEAEQGIGHVVATPHFYASQDNLTSFLERRAKAGELLRKEMGKHGGLPELRIGAEVYYFTGISESRDISRLAISSTNYIMIEMPQSPWTDSMYRELERIYFKQNLIPVIAHVDRYIRRFRTFGIPRRLSELPVVVQANAEFFLNKNTSAFAMGMLRSGKIHILGSDCHNLDSRKPNLGAAVARIRQKLGADAVAKIIENGQNILL